MAGFFTVGLAAATAAAGSLPGNGTSKIPMDTGIASGQNPQSVGVTPAQLGAAMNGPVVPLTDAATILLDASLGNLFSVTLAGVRSLTFSNFQPGQLVLARVTQDATGNRTLGITNSKLTSGTPLSTAAAAVDLVGFLNVGTLATPVVLYYPIAKAFA